MHKTERPNTILWTTNSRLEQKAKFSTNRHCPYGLQHRTISHSPWSGFLICIQRFDMANPGLGGRLPAVHKIF